MKGRVLDDRVLLMSDDDTVGTAVDDLTADTELDYDGERVVLSEDVPFGHKVALAAHEPGDAVRKYGEVIGTATARIDTGEWVHTHNCESTRGRGDRAAKRGETA
ncbi:altronate hydrolase [Salinigranum rubrum]|uniref:Altronate hydrolase n=1 Tax=Salinigranum rubrum TaxID=755307 RepID=A0A2I8VEL0_9EURY|nr:UxaA family hydrolase [Salinigranum rubrum]AUV80370.1 altronate hydrolase [Salinigranum rubrum]